jgi:trehalose 6-phosphate synthase/phosphatase
MDRLNYVKKLQQEFSSRRLTQKMKRDLIDNYSRSSSRLLLLDYDGTLIPFSEKPEDARPDRGLSRLLKALSTDPDNEVVIISGRDRKTLERWFRVTNGGLISEHGAWIKERGKGWETVGAFKNDWKEEVRPILELYVDRTPGSFIEEKDFSLVWHYRRVDPELSQVRRGELKDALLHLTANRNLGILEGSKVIEIKNMGINKGRAAMHWISKKNWDFILGVGDDLTDEDLFDALPESGYSIKVGYGASKAKFNVDSYKDVRRLLKEIGGMK